MATRKAQFIETFGPLRSNDWVPRGSVVHATEGLDHRIIRHGDVAELTGETREVWETDHDDEGAPFSYSWLEAEVVLEDGFRGFVVAGMFPEKITNHFFPAGLASMGGE
jgi:hypothetical protein